MKDYYEILQIDKNAEPEIIKAAYKALVKKYHPDVYAGSKEEANKLMQEINEAYKYFEDNLFFVNKSTFKNQTSKKVPTNPKKQSKWRVIILPIFFIVGLLVLFLLALINIQDIDESILNFNKNNHSKMESVDNTKNKQPNTLEELYKERKKEEDRVNNILALIVCENASRIQFNAWCSERTVWYRVDETNTVTKMYESKDFSNDQLIEMAQEYKKAIDDGLFTEWEKSEDETSFETTYINSIRNAKDYFDKYGYKYNKYLNSK